MTIRDRLEQALAAIADPKGEAVSELTKQAKRAMLANYRRAPSPALATHLLKGIRRFHMAPYLEPAEREFLQGLVDASFREGAGARNACERAFSGI